MAVSTVTSKGQITIPKSIRDRFELTEGSVLEFIVDEDSRIVLRPRRSRGVEEILGLLEDFAPAEPVSVEEMKRTVRARAGRKFRGKRG